VRATFDPRGRDGGDVDSRARVPGEVRCGRPAPRWTAVVRSPHSTFPRSLSPRRRGAGSRLLPWLAAFALLACGGAERARRGAAADSGAAATAVADTASAREVDDYGAAVDARPARRVVSLNPTTTEILFALGAGGRLVGRTRWDLFPDSARHVPDLGDGIRPNVEAILAARPDLVVLYAGRENRDAARRLTEAGVRVLALKVDRIADFQRATRLLGAAVGEPRRAADVVDSVTRTLDRVRAVTAPLAHPRVLWPMNADPLYVIGAGSFLSELVEIAGGTNVFADAREPSPQVSREEVLRRDADVVLASPTGARRYTTDPAWGALRAVRDGRVLVYDTTLVPRPAVRLGEAAVSLALLLHPEAAAALGVPAAR
jgi:iron complex transport system substrate-binding protein